MSFFDYILTPFLVILHLAAAYAIPIVATLRNRDNGQRWIIHWILFIIIRSTVFKVFDILFDGAVYWLLIVFSELGLLFALAQHTDAVKYKLLEIVKRATQEGKKYLEIAKNQIQKVEKQAEKQVERQIEMKTN